MNTFPTLLMIAVQASAGSTASWSDLGDGLTWLSRSYGAPLIVVPSEVGLSPGLEALRQNRPRLGLVVVDVGESVTADDLHVRGAACGVLVTRDVDQWLLRGTGECLATYSRVDWNTPLRPLAKTQKRRVFWGALTGAAVAGVGTGLALGEVEKSLDAAFGLALFGGLGAGVGGALLGAAIPYPSARQRRPAAHEVDP